MLTAFTMFAVGANIRRFVESGAMLRNVNITKEETRMIRTRLASVKIAAVNGSILADVVTQTGVLKNTVIFAFRREFVHKATMITDFPGDR